MTAHLRPLLSRLYVRLWYGRTGFSPEAYVERYPDVARSGLDPFDHFARHGRAEGRQGTRPDANGGHPPPSRVARIRTTLGLPSRRQALQAVLQPLLRAPAPRPPAAPPPPAAPDDFSAEEYLELYPDLAAAGVDPVEHFTRYGRNEGRLGKLPEIPVQGRLDALGAERDVVLVVCHDGTRTGAPVLGYNLVRQLLGRHDVVALFLGKGPMVEACREAGAVVVGPLHPAVRTSVAYADVALDRILSAVPLRFALVNSIESRFVLPSLTRRGVPTVTLLHEFAVDTRPKGAFREAALWSGEVVFSSALTRDNAVAEYPDLAGREYPIVPQGRCALPADAARPDRAPDEEARIARAMRPRDFPAGGFVVLGAGTVYFRKGVDLFLDCAARVLRRAGDLPVRFVWVGKVPDHEKAYAEFLADQVRRAGLERHVQFLDEVANLDAVYSRADALLLSSRLDPLPNVAIDALARGLPVICFERTTGIAEFLRRDGLADPCVAPYLDTEDAAAKLVALAREDARRRDVGERCARLAADFDMGRYVERLERLAARDAERARQEALDVETISRSDLPRADFHVPPRERAAPREEMIAAYVRSWATGILRRKLFPGFHPGVYREQHGVATPGADPLADWLRAGRPDGAWSFELVTPAATPAPAPPELRVALHVHAHYPELLPAMLERLGRNRARPDLLVSVSSAAARREVEAHLAAFGGAAEVREVPNRGRDIAPFLTELGPALRRYDVVGHLHTKKTLHAQAIGKDWYEFLLENLLGGEAPMADLVLGRMAEDPGIGIVFPDDPNVNGWDQNLPYVERILARVGVERPPRDFVFPIGTMFWARTAAIAPLLELGLGQDDYPHEPLPIDGTLLHGLERLFGLVAIAGGHRIALTHVPGRTR